MSAKEALMWDVNKGMSVAKAAEVHGVTRGVGDRAPMLQHGEPGGGSLVRGRRSKDQAHEVARGGQVGAFGDGDLMHAHQFAGSFVVHHERATELPIGFGHGAPHER